MAITSRSPGSAVNLQALMAPTMEGSSMRPKDFSGWELRASRSNSSRTAVGRLLHAQLMSPAQPGVAALARVTASPATVAILYMLRPPALKRIAPRDHVFFGGRLE